MLYALCFLLFMIGLYCVVVKKNMVKIVIGLAIMEYAVNLFLIMLGYRAGGAAPIIDRTYLEAGTDKVAASFINAAVDPLPQALVLTSIVISLGSLALIIAVCIRIYGKYGTFDITEIRRLKG
jgi:multicomponent Na+:H+ antiporter subunit C